MNRYVLSSPLNLSRLLVLVMLGGSLLHSVGATCLKDLAANVFCLTMGILSKIPMLLDVMFSLFCSLTDISSCRYFGAALLIHLWVIVSILNSIHYHIGSQCYALSDSVDLSYFDLPSASFTHMLWILCYLLRDLLGMPYSTAFE